MYIVSSNTLFVFAPLIYDGIIQVINQIRDLPILQYSTVNSAIMQRGGEEEGGGGAMCILP